jgi:sulfur relay (sulfurtransferase) DsrF/TusC family protein
VQLFQEQEAEVASPHLALAEVAELPLCLGAEVLTHQSLAQVLHRS